MNPSRRPARIALATPRLGAVAVFWLVLVLAAPPAVAQEWKLAYARGVEAVRQGQNGRAALLFEQATRAHPEPGEVVPLGGGRSEPYAPYLRLAKALLAIGKEDAAREALRRSEAWGRESAEDRARLQAALQRRAGGSSRFGPRRSPADSPPGKRREPEAPAVPPPSEQAPAPDTTPAPTEEPAAPPSTTPATAAPAPPESASAPGPGALVILSRPAGASVYVDDEYVGSTDPRSGRLVRSGVAPGEHRVRLARDGHEDLEREARVTAGEPTTLEADLVVRPRGTRLPGAAALLALGVLAVLGGLWLRRRRTGDGQGSAVSAATPSRTGPARAARPRAAAETAPAPLPRIRTAEIKVLPDPIESQETLVAPAAAAAATGERFGPYRLIQQLGKGGMATVYKAEREDEVCALKRPLIGFLEDRDFLVRFSREAEIGRTLHHPNIVRIRDRGEVDGVPYFTMELVEGRTLQAALARDGALAPAAAARVVAQVAEALDYAHLKGVIHRDLKPSNIMLLPDGGVKVMDYGIARARHFEGLTVTGAFLGTPDYVAPETAEGGGVDARSDLYSLGVVFYELVTGKRPFYGATPFETLRKHCTEPPRPPSTVASAVPRDMEALILRLLAKDPRERFPSAEELLIELRGLLNRAS